MNQLIEQYSGLLQKAEQTTSRNEAIKMIRESTKVREQMAEYSRLTIELSKLSCSYEVKRIGFVSDWRTGSILLSFR